MLMSRPHRFETTLSRCELSQGRKCVLTFDLYTVCPINSDSFYIVSYYRKWVTTSWTHRNIRLEIYNNLCIPLTFMPRRLRSCLSEAGLQIRMEPDPGSEYEKFHTRNSKKLEIGSWYCKKLDPDPIRDRTPSNNFLNLVGSGSGFFLELGIQIRVNSTRIRNPLLRSLVKLLFIFFS